MLMKYKSTYVIVVFKCPWIFGLGVLCPAPVSLVSLGVMESKMNISDLYANQGESYTSSTPAPLFFLSYFGAPLQNKIVGF
jgi:hypothetical protein